MINKSINTRQLILCAMFAALIAVGTFIQIPTGLIPFTMQVFFVILAGLLLEPKYSYIPTAVYAAMGLVGIPVFSKGGGFGYIYEPTFGFILGFIIFSFLVSALIRKTLIQNTIKKEKRDIVKIIAFSLLSLLILYIVGMTYMYVIMKFYIGTDITVYTLIISFIFYFIFDLIKFAIAIPLCITLLKRLYRVSGQASF